MHAQQRDRRATERAIARDIVRAFQRVTGTEQTRPTRLQANFHEDLVTVMMNAALGADQQNLASNGGGTDVRNLRWEVQESLRDEMVAIVEGHAVRSVEAYMSADHIDPDIKAMFFVLHPAPDAPDAD